MDIANDMSGSCSVVDVLENPLYLLCLKRRVLWLSTHKLDVFLISSHCSYLMTVLVLYICDSATVRCEVTCCQVFAVIVASQRSGQEAHRGH